MELYKTLGLFFASISEAIPLFFFEARRVESYNHCCGRTILWPSKIQLKRANFSLISKNVSKIIDFCTPR